MTLSTIGSNSHQNQNVEEQELEAQALEAIFDHQFSIIGPDKWAIEIYPEPTSSEMISQGNHSKEDDGAPINYVGCKLHVTLPEDYPESSKPILDIEILRGLVDEHAEILKQLANEEADANMGIPSIFAIAEKIREWLVDNNVKGLDDISMHAIMMRKEQQLLQQQKQSQQINTIYESHNAQTEMTQAELEELVVSKRRAEGTPCNKENFLIWQKQFDDEMKTLEIQRQKEADTSTSNPKRTTVTAAATEEKILATQNSKSGRLTGYQHFSDKTNNYEALEAAAERAAASAEDDDEDNVQNINNKLFEDDVDLDELDFDDEDDDDDDDNSYDDEDVDI